MSKIKINIEMDNDAFNSVCEFPRILRELARKMEDGPYNANIFDINGNIVGQVEVED